MNSKRFAELVSQAQSGDQTALEKLLLQAYTPVSYQCRKLLQNDQAAETITKKVLQRIPAQLDTLKNPGIFEKWLLSLTAKHCMQALRQQPAEKDPVPRTLRIPSEQLDPRETAMVVDQITDALPDDLRICITLYCCKIPVDGIVRLTGFEESAVKTHLSRGQALISGQLKKLSQQGVRFASTATLPELLQTAMYTPRNPKAASAMVNGILGKRAVAAPVPKPAKTAPGLKIAVAVVTALLVLMGGLILFLEKNRQAEPEMTETAVTTETETQPMETSVATTAAETTAETTVETTLGTTVATTAETTEAATEATTQPATEPAPQAQQAQGSQTASGNSSATAGGNATSGAGASSAAGGNHVHSYQDAGPIGVVSAGCESPGSRLKICFVCGDQVRYTDAVGLPAQGHNYSSKVKAPTEGSEGFTIHTCTRCGKTYMDNYVPKLTPATQPPVTQAPPAPQPEVTPNEQPEAAPGT